MATSTFDTGLGLEGSHVLITGSSGAIGSVVVKAFLGAGALVSGVDIAQPREKHDDHRFAFFSASIVQEDALENAFEAATRKHGPISVCVAVAGLDLSYAHHGSLVDFPLEEWKRIMSVNVDGTFLTSRAWLRSIRSAPLQAKNLCAIIFGSEAGRFGVSNCAAYAVSKAGIQIGLVRSLAKDAVMIHPKARVNAVAPGPVATVQFRKECEENPNVLWEEAMATVAMKQPVPVDSVARACLFLASENFSGNITGQVLPIDSGKSGTLYWPQDA